MERTTEQKSQEILDFFQAAFCAEKAQFATEEEAENLKPIRPIKITTTDGRGTFYISKMTPKEPCPDSREPCPDCNGEGARTRCHSNYTETKECIYCKGRGFFENAEHTDASR